MRDQVEAMDWDVIRRRLADMEGTALYRSLEEVYAGEARGAEQGEFPAGAAEWDDALSRRNFLKIMGASLALAGLEGCRERARDKIVPYVNPPEHVVPGRPVFFATAMPFGGYGRGVLAESHEGRPTKLEGNPKHPANLGGTDPFLQASVLQLYDPDRSTSVTLAGTGTTWSNFQEQLRKRMDAKGQAGGRGLRILSRPISSPTLRGQVSALAQKFPQARWHQYDPVPRANTAAGSRAAFGDELEAIYALDKAAVIVSLDGDFLFEEPLSLRYARQFIDGRRVRRNQMRMNRLYVVESMYTITGSMADHRLAVRPGAVEGVARALAGGVGVQVPSQGEQPVAWLKAAVDDLQKNMGSCVVIVGETQPPAVHALGHAMNQALGNVGKTVNYVRRSGAVDPNDLRVLFDDMAAGAVDTLVILGGNPAYDAPADIRFAEQLKRLSQQKAADGSFVNLTAHLGLYDDETSFLCQWHLPETHYLEGWSDVAAADGTASIIQPLIGPLYASRSTHEVVEVLANLGREGRGGYEVVRGHWQTQRGAGDFEKWWQQSLRDGVIDQSGVSGGAATRPAQAPAVNVSALGAAAPPTTRPAAGGLEIEFRPDPSVWDGTFANNAWLQELPRPFTKLVWDNAALISPTTSQKQGLRNGDWVTLKYRGRSVGAPVVILPGVADDTVVVHLGYGRWRAGRVGTSVPDDDMDRRGFNAYAIRTSDAPWFGGGAELVKTGRRAQLVFTRSHHGMATLRGFKEVEPKEILKPDAIASAELAEAPAELERNRRIVLVATLDEFRRNPEFAQEAAEEKRPYLSLYPGWDYSKGYQWGMQIDMTACIGCNACVVACQAENNIPVVGKGEVARQREMHWIRVDDYFGGTLEDPKVYHQPVTCMHCENAPCEVVCPTGATVHSPDGLNEMTYNRCIGTRYCSNNCPYKVRRFNFLQYSNNLDPTVKLQKNPDVTVRNRGVMEKCTYCVQRISRTRIEIERAVLDLHEQARRSGDPAEQDRLNAVARRRELEMLEQLQTACQQACPTNAIVFGNVNSRDTKVGKLKEEPHDYGLLLELTTRPRTTYLARISNPNPAVPGGAGGAA